MKNKLTKSLFALFIAVLFFVPFFVFAEEVNSFDQNIEIKENSDFIVEETIIYDFDGLQRHGIFRYIPYKYPNTKRSIEIHFLSAKDEKGKNYNYETGRKGDNVYIKIGDADIRVTGIKTYKIKYNVSGAINYFKEHDELYWNVTGNDWTVPINSVSTTITLPKKILEKDWKLECYTGKYSSKESFCAKKVLSGKEVNFRTKESLAGNEGLTVVAGWPKGITKEPTAFQKFLKFLSYNFLIFLPLIIFPWFFLSWRKKGKDPKGRGTIVAEYEPPNRLTPSEAEAIISEGVKNRGIAATIIDIARKGYFKIKETESKKLGVFKSKDWELIKTAEVNSNTSLQAYETQLMDSLFSGENSVKLSDLKKRTTLPEKIEEFKAMIIQNLVNKGYFPEKPSSAILKAILKGGLVIGAFLMLMIFSSRVSGLNILSIIISSVIVIIFGVAMPRRTKEGKEVEEELLGFKEFLSVTEKDRVKFHFSPQAHPEKFAEYLPYAIVFGVEKEWAGVFKGIDVPKPEWYEGTWVRGYTALVIADSLSEFNSGFSSSLKSASAASAAASGGSGFGGGGFSGGGFGGGGGGSW